MSEQPKAYGAELRWSNTRSGLEFAPLTAPGEKDSRRVPRVPSGVANQSWSHGGTEFGLLLQDDLERDGFQEGGGVIVIALPGRCRPSAELVEAVERFVREAG